jgi:hypothetical protein
MQMRDKVLIRQVESSAGVLKAVPRCLATLPGRERHLSSSVFIHSAMTCRECLIVTSQVLHRRQENMVVVLSETLSSYSSYTAQKVHVECMRK